MRSPDGERKKARLPLMVIVAPVEDLNPYPICPYSRTTDARASVLEETPTKGGAILSISLRGEHMGISLDSYGSLGFQGSRGISARPAL